MLEKIKKIIGEQLGIKMEEITIETNLKEDLGADSLDLYEFVMALEDEYSVEIPTEDLDGIHTVQDIINYLKEKGIDE